MTISEILSSFNTNYISKYRWEKDRINNLSAEDFLKDSIIEVLEGIPCKYRVIRNIEGTGYNQHVEELREYIEKVKK